MNTEEMRTAGIQLQVAPGPASWGILCIDPSGKIIGANSQGLKLLENLSGEAICGSNLTDFEILEESGILENIRRCVSSLVSGTFNTQIKTRFGRDMDIRYHVYPVQDASAKAISSQLIIEYWEEKKDLQEQPTQAANHEFVAALRKITHDFNNILSGILGYAELTMLSIEGNAEAEDNLRECIKSALRAKNLVLNLVELNRQTFGK